MGVLTGFPGIGKTAVAYTWAHRNQDAFPDGQLFIDFTALRGAGPGADTSEAVAMCLRALGVNEANLPTAFADRVGHYRTLSGGRRMLVVLDDVTRSAQVEALVPQGRGSALLATSNWQRSEFTMLGAALLPLDTLDRQSAVELLVRVCGRSRIDAEPEAAAELADLCGGLPLALLIVGARLVTHRRLTIAGLVTELTDEQSRLSRISVSSGYEERTVSAALELSYRDLPPEVARLFRVLGCLPGRTFDTALASVASGLTTKETQRLLDILESASLLTVTDEGRYRLHDLIRLHALETARTTDPPETERLIVERVTGHYLALTVLADLAVRADRLRITVVAEVIGSPDGGRAACHDPFALAEDPERDAIAWLEAERSNILAVLRAAARFGFDRRVWQLSEVFTVLFLHHRHLADWRESLELGAQAAARDGQAAAEARLRSLLSRPLLDLGRDEQARLQLEAAERLAARAGHLVLQASVQEFFGRYWDRHDPARAVHAYRTSLAINIQADEPRGRAIAEYFLGCAYSAAGSQDAARENLTAARDGFLHLGDGRMAARVLVELGRLKARVGEREAAVAALTDAVDELHEHRGFHYEAQALEDLADLLADPEEARDCLRRALAIYEDGGSPRAAELRSRLSD
ncbi:MULTISPECIES: tetratricopeptide repeat protein [unclassified Kitasatospora]|uniref:tetratricopeptide repeat protein n=1 Tax=unclassified Kitasatospora TaxID=2633591 RepID=UPI0024772696|nr:tetratricopeptide repeat protein [Kitasatospora sp. MAP12-44]